MSLDRVAPALARLDEHRELHLPLPKKDLLGRLATKFLWRRQLKWQVEANLAIREALEALAEQAQHDRARLDGVDGRGPVVGHEQLAHEVNKLSRTADTMTAGLNQRLFSALGRVEAQLGDLRLRLAETADGGDGTEQRIKALEAQVGELSAVARDVRLRHAQLDVFLDDVRTGSQPAEAAKTVADRDSFLELALSELLDGPAERVREVRGAHLPAVTEAREAGATGPVFDVAPGRGEWLEVLHSAGLPYRAVSPNSLVRKHNEGLGRHVEAGDALAALAETDGRSLGAVTAFRYAERLDPDTLARFFDLASRALQPGGVLIVETPEDGEEHVDPYARRTPHPMFLRFLAESAGFARAEVRTATGRVCLTAVR